MDWVSDIVKSYAIEGGYDVEETIIDHRHDGVQQWIDCKSLGLTGRRNRADCHREDEKLYIQTETIDSSTSPQRAGLTLTTDHMQTEQ